MEKNVIFLIQQLNEEIRTCLTDKAPPELFNKNTSSYEELYLFLNDLVDTHLLDYKLDFSQAEVQKQKDEQIQFYIEEAKIPFSDLDRRQTILLYLPPLDHYKQLENFSNQDIKPNTYTQMPKETFSREQLTDVQPKKQSSIKRSPKKLPQASIPSTTNRQFRKLLKSIWRYVKHNKKKSGLFAMGFILMLLSLLSLLVDNNTNSSSYSEPESQITNNNTYNKHIERANKAVEKENYTVAKKELEKAKKVQPVTSEEKKERIPIEKKLTATIKKQTEKTKETVVNDITPKEKPVSPPKENTSEKTNDEKIEETTNEEPSVKENEVEEVNEKEIDTEKEKTDSSSTQPEEKSDEEVATNIEPKPSDTLSTNVDKVSNVSFLDKVKNFFIGVWHFIMSIWGFISAIFIGIYKFLISIWTFISHLFAE